MTAKAKRILVVNGHPDPAPTHLCAALADAYVKGATAGGFEVTRLDVGALDFPLIRSMSDYQGPAETADIARAQNLVKFCDHIVLIFPIWFGSPPALFKGFLEQLMRYGFALSAPQAVSSSLLTGRSVRLMVTMGAPRLTFELLLGGHGVAALERGLLWVAGARNIRRTIFDRSVDAPPERRAQWLAEAEALGRRGA